MPSIYLLVSRINHFEVSRGSSKDVRNEKEKKEGLISATIDKNESGTREPLLDLDKPQTSKKVNPSRDL